MEIEDFTPVYARVPGPTVKDLIDTLSLFDPNQEIEIWGSDGKQWDGPMSKVCKGACENFWYMAPVDHICLNSDKNKLHLSVF